MARHESLSVGSLNVSNITGAGNFQFAQGKSFFVDPNAGSDSNSGLSPTSAKKTLTAGYAACTANKNDVVYLIGNNSGITLSAQLVWAKNYTHLVGLCAPVGAAKRSRIFQLSTLIAMDPLISITATGCMFKNFYVFQGVDDATSKYAVGLTSSAQRNYFENVHFAGIGHDTMDVATAGSLKLDGASENLFYNCQIGLDTIGRGTAINRELYLDGSASRNKFDKCLFYCWADNADHTLIEVADSTGIDRYLWLHDCTFLAESTNDTINLTSAFGLPALTQGYILITGNTTFHGISDIDSNNRGKVFNGVAAPAASGAGGLGTEQ